MKASFLFKIAIVMRGCVLTLYYSLLVLYRALSNHPIKRKRIDQLLRRWSDSLLTTVKMTYAVKGYVDIQYEPGRCYMIMSNHASFYDIPIIFCTMPGSIRMLAKRELFRVPIWGRAMRASEFVSISRGSSKQAVSDLQQAQEKMKNGIVLWVAPEGTRSRTGRLSSFKRGGFLLALETNAIIIPVGIQGADKVLPPKGLMAFNLHQHVEVHIGKPIDTAEYQNKRDCKPLMECVFDTLQTLLGTI